MQIDYYDALKLRRDASLEEVSASYMRLVLQFHPRVARDDRKTAIHLFAWISQAYEVLSNPLLRAYYDKNGYLALKQGHFAQGSLKGGYRFKDNPDQVFDLFFQNNNHLAKQELGVLFANAFHALNYTKEERAKDLNVVVPCSLNQLYLGVAKEISYMRRELNLDGITTRECPKQKLVQIKPGYSWNTVLKYVGEGHEGKRKEFSNLVLRIQELPHFQFKRKGDDLYYVKQISLGEAINCKGFTLKTLNKRTLRISVDQIIKPNTQICVQNQGMPTQTRKGNLIIRFEVQFPKQIAEKYKEQLRLLLQK